MFSNLREAKPAVACLFYHRPGMQFVPGQVLGTGFFINQDLLVTCRHVAEYGGIEMMSEHPPLPHDAVKILVFEPSGSAATGVWRCLKDCSFVVTRHPAGPDSFQYDLLVARFVLPPQHEQKFPHGIAHLPMADGSTPLEIGEELVCLSFAHGNSATYLTGHDPFDPSKSVTKTPTLRALYPLAHFGRVSAIDPPGARRLDQVNSIVSDLASAPGASGAPVLNRAGQIIGILTGGVVIHANAPGGTMISVPLGTSFIQPFWQSFGEQLAQLLAHKLGAKH